VLLSFATANAPFTELRAEDLKSDEHLIFFPTFAPLGPDAAKVEVPIHAWIFERHGWGLAESAEVRALGKLLGLDEAEQQAKLFLERAEPFTFDNERNKAPSVLVRGKAHLLVASTPDGHSESMITVAAGDDKFVDRRHLDLQLQTKTDDRRVFAGRVQLIGPEGLSVVSDIDDTIKFSNVLDKKELIRNTFVREFKPIDGMSQVYRDWEKKHDAVFHYVSGSPWQLYEPLAAFAKADNFPRGSFHLRKFRIKDRSALQFFGDPLEFKLATIEPILAAFPNRRFLLVGDSGELDPEVYGELARRRPQQIKLIAIRNITDAKPDDGRMTLAFRGVDMSRVLLFREAKELGAVAVR
jgi:hypothetical protein